MNLARYRKSILAGALAAVTALAAGLTDGAFTASEAVGVALAVLTTLGVYAVPNAPPANAAETWVEARLRTDAGNQPPKPAAKPRKRAAKP